VRLDPEKTTLTVRTKAEGFLSKLAHDLELRAHHVSGTFDAGRGTIRVPIDGLRVAGVVKRGKLDTTVLSTHDRSDIEKRIVDEVLAGGSHVEVDVEVDDARAQLTVRAPRGKQTVQCSLARDGHRARGECALSLSALGVHTVKGPMGAFRVADRVEVAFEAVFVD
jgi:hypothetical protein